MIAAAIGLAGTGIGAFVSYHVGRRASDSALLQQREERREQRSAEHEVRLRTACARLLASGRAYSHGLIVYRAGYDDESAFLGGAYAASEEAVDLMQVSLRLAETLVVGSRHDGDIGYTNSVNSNERSPGRSY